MDELVVVTYPQPLPIEARTLEQDDVPEGATGLAYFFRGHLIARGVISSEAVTAIHNLLENPVPVALAASEDDDGNIDGRVCLVLPVNGDGGQAQDGPPEEAWKQSVPAPPWESGGGGINDGPSSGEEGDDEENGHVALLPIGNVVRHVQDRHHADVAGDAKEMLENLLAGQAKDAVKKAIDDLLNSI